MTDEPLIMIDAIYPTKEQELPVPLISKTSPISPAFLAPPPPPQNRYNSPILSAVSSISTLSTINSPIPSVADFTTLSESQKMIQKQFEEIQVLRHDLTALNQKYIRQIEHSDSAEQAKHQVESEIEDLSRRLFEQANEMVSHEKKARHIAEKKQRLLERKLESLAEDLKNERAQLNELRLKFEQEKAAEREKNPILKYIHPLDKSYSLEEEEETETETEDDDDNSDKEINTRGVNTNTNDNVNDKPKQQLLQQPLKQQIHHPHHHHQQHHQQLRTLDQKWLKLFQDFLIAAQSHSLESLHRLPFLKLCMELDIEPCLKFGNTTKPKNHHLSVKRVLEAVMHHPCYIEPLTDDKKRLSQATIQKKKTNSILSSSSSPSDNNNNNRRASFAFGTFRFRSFTSHDDCYGCSSSLKNSTVYRFKLKEQDTEWFYIDKTCRDQLVAVCDFYVFIRHVKSGLQSQRNCQSLFQECLWLRLCMFWARSGVSL